VTSNVCELADVENMMEIFCGNCGIKLDDKGRSCPNCGSSKQELMITLKDTINITVHSKIGNKFKKEGIKKPVFECMQGDDPYKKSGTWNHRKMTIDRENNKYTEIITDKDTNELIHFCEEPLSEHFGHSSAKYKPKNNIKKLD